ncbi:MAG: phosphoribosylamine--glycine ligase [Ignavibacteriae bacterium]|nr:phosphoribosylamine--glycine ligase [Ignavibacteriota bacterium]
MNILLIGSGGREHALAWKMGQSPSLPRLYCAPGNAGIGEIAELVPIKATDLDALLTFAREQSIDLTVVGPEQPLTQGIVDLFESNGLKIFGPSKAAAKIEGSKIFAKTFMKKYSIPTAEFRTFNVSQRFDAERYINEIPVPIVIKADGLATGKGVTVCETKEQALEVLELMMDKKVFGEAGTNVVIEEFLVGEEASVFAITDGKDFVTLAPAQDHKRILDNDQGKNTGGMGAYAPTPIVDDEMLSKIKRTIIRPTLLGLAKEGHPYKGCLYVGLMITQTGPKVVEFNCRFGDPETQVVLPLLENDLVRLMLDAIEGRLSKTKIVMKKKTSICVVIASGGYPDEYQTGKQIIGLDAVSSEPDVIVLHAGTKKEKDNIVTAGGRVLGVTALGAQDDLEGTIDKAYRAVEKITFDGAYYRSDIGKKGVDYLKRLQRVEVQ